MSFLLPALAFGTLLAGLVFALHSQRRMEQKLRDPSHKKSTLAIDGPGRAPLRQPELLD